MHNTTSETRTQAAGLASRTLRRAFEISRGTQIAAAVRNCLALAWPILQAVANLLCKPPLAGAGLPRPFINHLFALLLPAAVLASACGIEPPRPGASGGDAAAPPVRLIVQSGYNFSMPILGDAVRYLEQAVAEQPGHGIDLRVYDADKLAPTLGIFDAVAAGKIDAGYSFPGYWFGKMPAVAVFGAVPFGPRASEILAWLQEGGGLALWREIYAPHGVVPLPCGALPPEASGWFRKPIRKLEDLRGLKVRYVGLGGEVLQKLGASVTLLAAGDLFLALERGVLDATEYALPAVDRNLGFHRVAKHYYFPGWHQPASILELIVNRESWERLAPGQRKTLTTACKATTGWMLSRALTSQADDLAFFEAQGVQVHTWPSEILQALRSATREVLAELAAKDADFARTLASQQSFVAAERPWSSIAYPPQAQGE